MTQQSRRRRRPSGGMRRTYIVVIAGLIILGVASTFALTYVQTELEEPWGAQYTLQYTGASVELDNPETIVVDDDTVEVYFDVTPNDKEVTLKIVVTPLDINGDPIVAVGSSDRTCTVTWYKTGGAGAGQLQASKQVDIGADFEVTLTMPSVAYVESMRVKWVDTGFTAEYEGVRILVEDVES